MARILLTGNRGFFGSRFQMYHGQRHRITGIDKDDVDITDRERVIRVIETDAPDIVIHGAAITSTDFSNRYPDLTRAINVDGALNVAEGARKAGAQLLFFSTEQVFNGNEEPGPYAEDHPALPDTMYGRTKLEAERLLRDHVGELWIARFTWMFGLPEYGKPTIPNVVYDALRIALSSRRTRIPLHEYRGLTYVYHMIERVLGILELPAGTYHVGSRNDLSRYEIFRHVFRGLGVEDRIEELLEPDSEKYRVRPRDVRLNTDKLTALGIVFPDSAAGISECLNDYGLWK